MERNKKYQIIGAHTKASVVSFDDAIRTIMGIFYDISFEHDFENYCVDGQQLVEMPIDRIIELIRKAEADYEAEDMTAYWHRMATINSDVANIVYTEKEYKKLVAKGEKRMKEIENNEIYKSIMEGFYEEADNNGKAI